MRFAILDNDGNIKSIDSAKRNSENFVEVEDNFDPTFKKYDKKSKKWIEDEESKLEEESTQKKELLIQNKLRQMAIDALIVDGLWTE